MRIFKRVLGLTGITAIVAAVAAAAPAAAQTTAACSVSGKATVSPAVKIQGGSGGYTFAASAGVDPGLQLNCVIGNSPHGSGVATLNVTSTGRMTFSNASVATFSSFVTNAGTVSFINSVGTFSCDSMATVDFDSSAKTSPAPAPPLDVS